MQLMLQGRDGDGVELKTVQSLVFKNMSACTWLPAVCLYSGLFLFLHLKKVELLIEEDILENTCLEIEIIVSLLHVMHRYFSPVTPHDLVL